MCRTGNAVWVSTKTPWSILFLLVTIQACGDGGSGAGATEAAAKRGEALFVKHCATCHGEKGMGDGPAAYLLHPKPRNFGLLEFRLISTDNGFPRDQDLFDTITSGMPGSSMPPWEHLPADDRWALVAHVKKLTFAGKVAMLVADDTSREEATEIAREQCVAGKPVVIPAERPPTDALLARGKQIYTTSCQSCHDADGRGRLKRDLKEAQGYPIFARDFTRGIFKGGASAKALATRFIAGMPGTPMPSFTDQFKTDDDLWALVHYIRSFIAEGVQERVRQRRTELVAKRSDTKLTTDPDSVAWSNVPPVWLPVMPLWWRDDAVPGLDVQALHDGSALALRVSWQDASQDDHQIGQTAFGDSVAVQWSADADPPFLAMGTPESPVNIWQWKAAWQGDLTGFRDIQFRFPRASWDLYPSLKNPPFGRHSDVGEFATADHEPEFLTGWGANNPMSNPLRKRSVDELTARGFGTLTSRPAESQTVQGNAHWRDGTWVAVFVRPLAASGDGSVAFAAGSSVSVAFAVWNGSNNDRDGQKSVSIWHSLRLDQ